MTAEAIEYYNSLLEGPLADDAIERLCEGTIRYNLRFGDRPICAVLRPMFVTERQYERVRRDATLALSAIERLYCALMADGQLRGELALTPDEERLISIAPSFGAPDASGRLNAVFDSSGEFHIVGYDADSPGGPIYGDALGEIFIEMDVAREFARKFPLRRVEVRPCLLESLLCSYRQWGGRDHPRIAIADWNDAAGLAEVEICREYFESRGYPTIIADPEEFEYRGGWLRAGNFRINLVYKRVAAGELLSRGGLRHPLIRAAQDRAICVVNSFRAWMLAKKALFALLDDPQYESLFTGDEVEALRRLIPWTRVLREGFTTYRDERISLIDFVASRRDALVLKPNDDYSGRGAVFGWQCDDDEWRRAISDALGASFIVQERVEALREPFPTLSGGQIRFEDRHIEFEPYTWLGDHIEGAGVRLSSPSTSNAAAGGDSATPALIIEEDLTKQASKLR